MARANGTLRVDDEISLVPAHEVDPTALLDLVRANIGQLGEWLGWAAPDYSVKDVEAFFESSRGDWASGSALSYGILHEDRLQGTIGMGRLKSPARDFEIGYWLSRDAQGRGVVTRACNALLREAFLDLGANLVVIRAAAGNTRSRAVATRLGMTEEATLRRRSNNARGELLDLVVYSITAEEWRARSND